jgi:hypothetical protein
MSVSVCVIVSVSVWVSENTHDEQLSETSRILLGVVVTCRDDGPYGTVSN